MRNLDQVASKQADHKQDQGTEEQESSRGKPVFERGEVHLFLRLKVFTKVTVFVTVCQLFAMGKRLFKSVLLP